MPLSYNVQPAETDNDIQRCFVVMSQLRPHLTQQQFFDQVKAQMQGGYRLACAMDGDSVVAVAGYRLSRSLSWGKYLYVDDLVTDENRRSQGFGKAILQWLIAEARRHGCAQFHLDSGTQRKDAHCFYEREGMTMMAYHFALVLD
jgi:GNAT superfamily N-acetyltransferase